MGSHGRPDRGDHLYLRLSLSLVALNCSGDLLLHPSTHIRQQHRYHGALEVSQAQLHARDVESLSLGRNHIVGDAPIAYFILCDH